MLVFERDPEAPAADSQGNSYMQEVMSYEHAVLTPAWVATSVTYKRDPHEVKTWFMGGDQANLTARETSQGTFIAYTSNAPPQGQQQTVTFNPTPTATGATATSETITGTLGGAGGKLGFVVMDYTLDLISPNVLPNKVRTLGGQQYQQVANFGLQNPSSASMPSSTYQQQFLLGAATGAQSLTAIPGLALAATGGGSGAGTIVEVVLDGGVGSFANNGQGITSYLQAYDSGAAMPNNTVLVSGSRFYMVQIQSWNQGTAISPQAVPGNTSLWYAAATLADAIGLAGVNGTQTVISSGANTASTYQVQPNALACSATTWGAYNQITQQNAFVRILSAPKIGLSTA